MDEKSKFTTRDHLLGICQAFEIGLPFQDRWSKTDVFHGRCSDQDVGQPRHLKQQIAEQQVAAAADADAALVALNLEGLRGYQREAATYHADPDSYTARKPPGVVKAVLDWIQAEDIRNAATATSVLDKALDDIRAEDADQVIYRVVLSSLADDDAERATIVRQALGMEDWQIRDMIGQVGAELPEAMRQDVARHLMNPL
jgi:hypothetical protein